MKPCKSDKIGLISTNLAEKIAMTAPESPYRVTAETINNTCSAMEAYGYTCRIAVIKE